MTTRGLPGLRHIALVGPEGRHGPLWTLETALLHGGGGAPSGLVVDRTQGVRALNRRAKPETLGQGGDRIPFLTPDLMTASVVIGGPSGTSEAHARLHGPALRGPGRSRPFGAVRDETGLGAAHEVIVAPAEPWPHPAASAEIVLPRLRLVAGRLPVRLLSKRASETLLPFLGVPQGKKAIFGVLPIARQPADSRARPEGYLAFLTPDGIEFDLGAPNPAAELPGGPSGKTLPARVRLEPNADSSSGYGLRLVAAGADGIEDWRQVRAALQSAFASLRRDAAPLRVDMAARAQPPALTWLLPGTNPPERLALAGLDDWDAALPGGDYRVRLQTEAAPGRTSPTVARLNLEGVVGSAVRLLRRPAPSKPVTTLRYTSGVLDPSTAPARVTALFCRPAADKSAPYTLASLTLDGPRREGRAEDDAPAVGYVDAWRAAARQGARLRARGVMPEGRRSETAPALFFPLFDGVLQIAIPDAAGQAEGATRTVGAPTRNALTGGLALRWPSGAPIAGDGDAEPSRREPGAAMLLVDAAVGAQASVSWSAEERGDVEVVLSDPRGRIDGLLWMIARTPSRLDALVTGTESPSATEPIPIELGARQDGNVRLAIDGRPRARFDIEIDPCFGLATEEVARATVLWVRHPVLPLVSTANMLRAAASALTPSATRGLFPVEPRGRLVFSGLVGQAPLWATDALDLRHSDLWPWPAADAGASWGPPTITMAAPTAPGLEYAAFAGEPADDFLAALRYDLPVLDELFASFATSETRDTKETPRPAALVAEPGSPAAGGEATPPTTLDLDRLGRLVWRPRVLALALARTQGARATPWGGVSDGLRSLVEPYETAVTVSFGERWLKRDGDVSGLMDAPLGRFALTWERAGGEESDDVSYAGDNALAGLGGPGDGGVTLRVRDRRLELAKADEADQGAFVVKGFAASLYRSAGGPSGPWFDTRGFGAASALRASGSADTSGWNLRLRDGVVLDAVQSDDTFCLGTLERPLGRADPSADQAQAPLRFWFRDLPLRSEQGGALRFEAVRTEAGDAEGRSLERFDRIEAAIGPRSDVLDRDAAPCALHEWRLWSEPGRWDIPLGPPDLPLRFRPLRLLSVDIDASAVVILGSVVFDRDGRAPRRTEGYADDRPYDTGNLARLHLRIDGGDLRVATLERVRAVAALEGDGESAKPGFFEVEPIAAGDPAYPLAFDLDADVKIEGAEDVSAASSAVPLTLLVRLEAPASAAAADTAAPGPTGRVAGLQARLRLFGAPTTIDLNRPAPRFDIRSAPEGIHLVRAGFALRDAARPLLTLRLAARVPLTAVRADDAVTLCRMPDAFRLGDCGAAGFLGVTLPPPGQPERPAVNGVPRALTRVSADHGRGVLSVSSGDPAGSRATPVGDGRIEAIRGLAIARPQVWLDAQLVAAAPMDGPADGAILSWRLADFHVAARMASATDRSDAPIARLRLVAAPGERGRSRIGLDLLTPLLRSCIRWPVGGLRYEAGSKASAAEGQVFDTQQDSAAWRHKVRPFIMAADVPPENLAQQGAACVLVRPLELIARVEHALVSDAESGAQHCWASLDRITLIDAERLPDLAAGALSTAPGDDARDGYAFAPRYRFGSYRDFGSADRAAENRRLVRRAGFARPALAESGFSDERLLRAVREESLQGLLLLGGAPLLFHHIESGDAIGFQTPWAAALRAAPARAPSSALQSFESGRRWKAAAMDLRPVVMTDAAPPTPRLKAAPLREAALIAALDGAAPLGSGGDADGQAGDWRATRVVEQAYLEAVSESDNPLSEKDAPPLREWPLFLRALVGLKAVLERGGPRAGRVIALHSRFPREGSAAARRVAVQLSDFAPKPTLALEESADEPTRLHLRVLSRGDGPAETVLGETNADNVGRARAREIAGSLAPDPLAILLIARDGDGFPLRVKTESPEERRVGARRALRPADQTIHPSAALGWPDDPHDGRPLHRFAPIGGPDEPIVAERSGVAGRSTGLVLRPLVGRSDGPALFLGHSGRICFQRREEGAAPASVAAAPPTPMLTPAAPRVRIPTRDSLGAALDATGARAGSALIVPPAVTRAHVGQRPGVLVRMVDAIFGDGALPKALDDERPDRGAPASLAPILLRQLRTPRAPRLPRTVDIDARRRTYVSLADRVGQGMDGDLRQFLAIDGAATVLRLDTDAYRARLAIDAPDACIGLSLAESGRFALRFSAAVVTRNNGAPPDIMTLLHEARLLRAAPGAEGVRLRATLVIGEESIDFAKVSWPSVDEGADSIRLFLLLDEAGRDRLAASLQAADPDTQALLLLQQYPGDAADIPLPMAGAGDRDLAGPAASRGFLASGPPLSLAIPLMLRDERRGAPAIAVRTIAFGDPALDRRLGSPAATESATDSALGDRVWWLALDRARYDLATPLHFAFGLRDNSTGAFAFGEKVAAEVAFARRRASTSDDTVSERPLVLSIPPRRGLDGADGNRYGLGGAGDGDRPIDGGAAFVVSLGDLRLPDQSNRASLAPGDQLLVAVNVFDGGLPKSGDMPTSTQLRIAVDIVADPVLPPSDAAYSVVDVVIDDDADVRAQVMLHETSPIPQRVEFPDLLGDLARGYVRRRALFLWTTRRFLLARDAARYSTLVKTDRAGGAQLPQGADDFDPPWPR